MRSRTAARLVDQAKSLKCFVDGFATPDHDNHDDELVVVHFVDDTEIPGADSVEVMATAK